MTKVVADMTMPLEWFANGDITVPSNLPSVLSCTTALMRHATSCGCPFNSLTEESRNGAYQCH